MKIESSRFGTVNVTNDKVIKMQKGLYGFNEANRFMIVEHRESSPFKWLQSVDCPDLAFVVVDPVKFFSGYKIALNPEDKSDLELESEGNIMVYVLVVVPTDPREMTANMLGPIIINPVNMLAKQVILMNDDYTTKQSLLQNLS